jgi:CRP-like cAMP-binding protein
MTNSKVVSVGGSGMTTQHRFNKGDVLFRQGDVSDSALRVSSGEIEVLREVGTASVVLGHVQAGEWLGEMGVVENRSRSATARAVTDGAVEILTARQFLDRVSSDPNLARELILRLIPLPDHFECATASLPLSKYRCQARIRFKPIRDRY